MEVVQRNGQRLLNLVNRLLDFWGIEAAADDYLTELFSDRELLARVKQMSSRRNCGPKQCSRNKCCGEKQKQLASSESILSSIQ